MPETEPTTELNEGFSEPGAAARPWAVVAEIVAGFMGSGSGRRSRS